jgi:uncharacterized membrane protein YtjA (UPF0391 family)
MIRSATGLLGIAIAIAAAAIGFTGFASHAAAAGRWVFCTALVLTGIALLHGPRTVT